MLATITYALIFFAGQKGGFMEFYNKYLNYPGFEFWKFLNLAIFVAVLVHLLRKPLSEKFKQKRDEIRAEIIRAAREKEAAMSRLATAEARLAGLEGERASIIREAEAEAEAEVARLLAAAEEEAERLKSQSENEITRLYLQAKSEIRRFTAEESIRKAESKLKERMNPEIDGKIVQSGIEAIGGLN